MKTCISKIEDIKPHRLNFTKSSEDYLLLSSNTSFELTLKIKNQESDSFLKSDTKLKNNDSNRTSELGSPMKNSQRNLSLRLKVLKMNATNSNEKLKDKQQYEQLVIDEFGQEEVMGTPDEEKLVIINRDMHSKNKEMNSSEKLAYNQPSENEILLYIQNGFNSSLALKPNYSNFKDSFKNERAFSVINERKCCFPCNLI